MKTPDFIILEQLYNKVLFQEMLLPNFQEIKESIEEQINSIVDNPDISSWLLKRISTEISKSDEREVSQIINLRDHRFTNEFRDKIVGIKDYLNSLQENELNKSLRGDFNSVSIKADKWHEKLAKTTKSSKGDGSVEAYLKDTKPFYNLNNGWKIVQLTSMEACKLEGGEMQHCVGGGSYTPQNILSLRDPKGHPHATIEIKHRGSIIEIHQIKGKQNRAPKNEYKSMIRQMIRENPDKFDVKAEGSNIGFIEWRDSAYDPDSEKWQQVLKSSIIPARQKIKNDILKNIKNTKINESKKTPFNKLYKKIMEDLEAVEAPVKNPTKPQVNPTTRPSNPNPFRKPSRRPSIQPKPKAVDNTGVVDKLRNINNKYGIK